MATSVQGLQFCTTREDLSRDSFAWIILGILGSESVKAFGQVEFPSSPGCGKDCSLLPSEVTPDAELWNGTPTPALPVLDVLCGTKICEPSSACLVPWSSMSAKKERAEEAVYWAAQHHRTLWEWCSCSLLCNFGQNNKNGDFVSLWYQCITLIFPVVVSECPLNCKKKKNKKKKAPVCQMLPQMNRLREVSLGILGQMKQPSQWWHEAALRESAVKLIPSVKARLMWVMWYFMGM